LNLYSKAARDFAKRLLCCTTYVYVEAKRDKVNIKRPLNKVFYGISCRHSESSTLYVTYSLVIFSSYTCAVNADYQEGSCVESNHDYSHSTEAGKQHSWPGLPV